MSGVWYFIFRTMLSRTLNFDGFFRFEHEMNSPGLFGTEKRFFWSTWTLRMLKSHMNDSVIKKRQE